MSSGAGEVSGAGDLDLNCDIVAVLDNHEAGVESELEDGLVSAGGELLVKGWGETMDVGGDEKKECERGIADWKDGMMGNGEGSAGSEIGGLSEVGVVGTVRMEAVVDSHGGKLLEVEFGEKGSAELVSVSAVSFEDAEASSQTMNLGDGSDGNQKRSTDVDMEGVMGIDEVSSTVLVGRGTEVERLEGSSILRREQVEIQVNLANESGNLVDGQLNIEEWKSKGDSLTMKLLEVVIGEKEITDLVSISAEKFEAIDGSNNAVSLGNVSSGDQKQEIDVDVKGMFIDHQFGPGEREAHVAPHTGTFLEVKEENGCTQLFVVSTKGLGPFESNIHTVNFDDESGVHQKRGTDLDAKLDLGEKGRSTELVAVEVSGQAIYFGDGFDEDKNNGTDVNKEDLVGTDKGFLTFLVCSGGAEGESMEGSSHLREVQVEVNLVDGGVHVVDDQLGPEESKAESEFLGIKMLEDARVRQIADLVAVSSDVFEAVEARNQPVMEMDTGGNECAYLVAVSEEFESVEASNQPLNLGDGSGGDQKQGLNLADKSLKGEFLEVDKGGEGSALLSVSTVENSSHHMDFHDGSDGDQKKMTDLYGEVMVIDGAVGSGKGEAEVETPGGKLLEMDRVEKGSTVLVSFSNERFEHSKICKQTMDLSAGSGYDQRLETHLDAEGMVEISEDSTAVSVGSGLLKVEREATGQAINLLLRSGDDQSLVTDVDAEGIVRTNEDSVTISIGSGGPEDGSSGLSLVLRKELVEIHGDLHDEKGGEVDTVKREAEFKSYIGRSMEVDKVVKWSAKLFGASAELSEAAVASNEAMNFGDGYVGEQKCGADVDTEGLMGDEVSLTVLVGGEADDEKMQSSILRREQFKVQVDLVDGSDQVVDCQFGCGERGVAVDSHEEMPLELHIVEKESADLVSVSAKEFEAIEASNHAMNSGGSSGGEQIQGIDADAEGMDRDAQLGAGERNAEVYHSRKLLEVDKRVKESSEQVAVSTEIFEPLEANGQATDFGDESDCDQRQETDVNAEGMAIDAVLRFGKSAADVEYHGEEVLEVDRDIERSAQLPFVSTEGLLPCKASREAMNLIEGCGSDQRLETGVDAEAMVRTDEYSVNASGAPDDTGLERSLTLKKGHVEVQGKLADGIGEVVEGKLATAISVVEVNVYGGRCMEVDIGENTSTKLVAATTKRPEVEDSTEAMDFEDGSGIDQIQGTDADAEGVVGDREYATVTVVGKAQGNERLEGSLTLGEEQVEFLVHSVDGYGQAENEQESHGGRLLEVELGEKRKEFISVSAERFEAVEVSCQAMELGDRSGGDQMEVFDVNGEGMINIFDDSAAASAGRCPGNARLEEESSVLGIEHVMALQKSVDGCVQVADNDLIHGVRTPNVASHGGKLLKVEAGVKGCAEPFVNSVEGGLKAVDSCSSAMDLEHGSGGDQKQRTYVDAEYVVGNVVDSVNVSCAVGEPEVESLERSLLFGKVYTEVLPDLVDGHDQVLDCVIYPGKTEAEVEPHSEKLLELDVGKKVGSGLASVAAEGSCAFEDSSQAMDLEVRYPTEQEQETNVDAACMVRTDEDSVVILVDGGGSKDEILNGSSKLVKDVEVGEETNGTGSTVKDLSEFTNTEVAGYEILMHATQDQTEFGDDQRQGTDLGAHTSVGGTEQASLSVSDGCKGPEDVKLETSYNFGEKQDDFREDYTVSGTPEKKSAYPEKIESCGVDAMIDTGHPIDLVHIKCMEDLDSREGFGGDHRPESCIETDAEPLVIAVAYQGTEAHGLEAAPRSDGVLVKVKYGSDGSQIVEKVAPSQQSGESMNVDVVCDLVKGHSDEMDGEIVGDKDHNQSEVNSEFSAGEENMIEKGLACLHECVEIVHDFRDHDLDDKDSGIDGNGQETVIYKNQDISLETFQGSRLELMEVETVTVHHSTVGSERVEALTHTSSVEIDLEVFDENNTLAGETVQKPDSIPISEEQDSGSQQLDEDMKQTVVMAEACSSDEHTAVDNMEKGNVNLEDNGSVIISVTSAELQNGDAQLNFDHLNQNINSSPLMVSCREEEAHAVGPHSPVKFFMEKGYGIMEDSNSLLGISIPESSAGLVNLTITPQWNEPSIGSRDLRSPNIPYREHEELEPKQGTPALNSALHFVDETIDSRQKLQDGALNNLMESKNQSEGCDGTMTESTFISQQATYYLSFSEKEGFSTSDLVWGKVKSHPWWPGQIFDFSGASKLAIKYQKKDHFLVAYFGDKTFAWCEEARLKPFLLCFSQMEKQTSSDSFIRALSDILAEISRRVELSMTCLCVPEEAYADITYQRVENAGVRGKTVNSVFDRCEVVNYFHPDQLLEYVKELAQLPTGGADRLQLTVAQSQLKAYYLSKGFTELPAFTNGSGLIESDFETPSISKKLNEDDLEHSATLSDLFSTKGKLRGRDGALGKQKHIMEDGRKQKSLSELMEEETTFLLVNRYENGSEVQNDENFHSFGNKRKAPDYVSTDMGRSKTKKIDYQADDENRLLSPTSNSSFKVGEFISRAASKLTSGQPIRKCHSETSERALSKIDDWSIDYMDLDDFLDVPFDYPKLQIDISVDYPPTNEMLSKLCLAARNPMKGYNFSSTVINFFCTFRNVQVSNISIEKNQTEKPRAKRGRKKKIILDLESLDMSTPDHMKDSYWSDMIIPEKDSQLNLPKRRGRKKRKFIEESSPFLMLNSPSDCEPKLLTGTICPHVKHILTAERPIISVEEKIVDERTPTAVILYFNSSNSLPSDMDLIRIFSRFGPLKEEETYIERKNNSAMVVFKKRTDAEMAFSSAGKFSTFGPALLSYRLKHFPSKSSPVNTMIVEVESTPINDGCVGILAEPEFNGALDGKLCEAVDKESSIFVQSQEHFEPLLDMLPGEFSELAQYQVGDAEVSDSTPANTGKKEPSQDVPAQMETCAVSDHLMLESLDQEFSYFDLDQAEAGDVSGTEVGGEKSSGLLLETLEVSDAANVKSLNEGSCDPLIAAENGTVLKTTTQLEAVDLEFSGFALPAEPTDSPDELSVAPDQSGEKECSDSSPAHVGAGSSDRSSVTADVHLTEADSSATVVQALEPNSNEEQREVLTVSDSTHTELEKQAPSVSVTNVEPTGMVI